MNDFKYVNNELWCEEVPVAEIAQRVGTPFYLYSHRTLSRHFHVFDQAFEAVDHIICFSAKSNSNIAILRVFTRQGGGVDIVSGGELFRALKAGVDPKKVVYSGVGKRRDEIEYALREGILMFNVESSQELDDIHDCARNMGQKAGVALRVNPDVDAQTHPHISTGLKENKFGIDIERSLLEYRKANTLPYVDIMGVSCHIGSQVTKVSPFIDTMNRLKKLVHALREEGIQVRFLDLGGGLGITYDREEPPHPSEYAQAVIEAARDLHCTLIFEPGRVIVGNAGILVTKVLYTKSNEDKNFIVVDAGMNDLIRPGFYNAYHQIQPVVKGQREEIQVDVVGPICESSDYLAKERKLPLFDRSELMAVMSAGAYGFSMASNYNSRPKIAEVLVRDNRFHVIRRRETYTDLIRGEKIPAFLKRQNEKTVPS
ncbi:MAG: diaminopimelate decarboxylase [Deltaproteobacteria bacterium]|nr:diaminopimelate decarboxylase [Deltaproteobacteria bacterium]